MCFDELGEDAEKAFQYLSNSAKAAAAVDVKTLSQWNNISVEKQKEIMSEKEWKAWNNCAEIVKQCKREPNFMFNHMTYHHKFKGSTSAMLGNERNQHVKTVLSDMTVHLEPTTSQTKEIRPIYIVWLQHLGKESLCYLMLCVVILETLRFLPFASSTIVTPHIQKQVHLHTLWHQDSGLV